jgi:phosphopantetheinyl transferase
LAVIAVNRSAEVGIDLERKRPIQEAGEIVRYFSLAPVALSQSAEAMDADKFFVDCTRLEAGAKCLHVGLSKVDPARIKDPFKHTIFLCRGGEEYALSMAREECLWNIIIFHRFRSRCRATVPVREHRLAWRKDCRKIKFQGDSDGR